MNNSVVHNAYLVLYNIRAVKAVGMDVISNFMPNGNYDVWIEEQIISDTPVVILGCKISR